MAPTPPGPQPLLTNTRISGLRPLIPPALLRAEIRLTSESTITTLHARDATSSIIHGHSPRLLVLSGPCTINNPYAALAYASRLRKLASTFEDELLLVMRVRTGTLFSAEASTKETGAKGINAHLRTTRQLLADITASGVPACTELADCVSPLYFADLASVGVVGERDVRTKVFEELSSGCKFPVGFIGGDSREGMEEAVDAAKEAARPQYFLGVVEQGLTAVVETRGNEDGFVIVRGVEGNGSERCGDEEDEKRGGRVVVDFTSGKGGRRSGRKRGELAETIGRVVDAVRAGDRSIVGVVLESTIHERNDGFGPPGSNGLRESTCSASSCLEWNDTVEMLGNLVAAVREGRGRREGS